MTAAIPLFELGGELAGVHARSAPGSVKVVPVIVDDLALAEPIIKALSAITVGRVFQASDAELRDPVPATSDVVRLKAIETALREDGGPRRVVLFEPAPGLIDARFEPASGGVPSAGEAVVLAAARAFAHAELDDRELAIISYSENTVDLPFRRCLWSLVNDQLTGLPHPTLRTLIVVVESSISIALHCQPGRGFRFAINGTRLLRRHGLDDLNATAAHLARHMRPCVFFLGAGFSASSKLPLGNTLRDTAIKRLLGISDTEVISSEQLARRFHGWVSERGNWMTESERLMREDTYVQQLTLEQVIRAEKRFYGDLPTLHEFKVQHDDVIDAPGAAATDLAYVLRRMQGRAIIVEVNFDLLVESHSEAPLRVFYTEEHFEHAPEYIRRYIAGEEHAVPVLKVHGSIEDLESCVANDEQTLIGIGQWKLNSLRALIAEENLLWVYVGASMRDRDLLPVFRSEEFARRLDERWVSPYLDEGVETFARERIPFWAATPLPAIDDRLISETADAFFAALRRELT